MQIDPRAPRFAAWITTAVLAAVLLAGGHAASGWLLAAQTLVFATGAAAGLRRSPYGWLYQRFVAPRLGPPAELEPAAPPRFAQVVGLAFAAVGTVGFLAGVPVLGDAAAGLALAAAFLNAAFGLCLGCELYLILRRTTARAQRVAAHPTVPTN
jgi:hypothetical protein